MSWMLGGYNRLRDFGLRGNRLSSGQSSIDTSAIALGKRVSNKKRGKVAELCPSTLPRLIEKRLRFGLSISGWITLWGLLSLGNFGLAESLSPGNSQDVEPPSGVLTQATIDDTNSSLSSPPFSTSVSATTSPDFQILSPEAGTVLETPAATIRVQSPLDHPAQLWVNGVMVDVSLRGRTETDTARGVMVQTWYGVSLQRGKNQIEARIPTDLTLGRKSLSVAVAGSFSQLWLDSATPKLTADGKSLGMVRGELRDAQGHRTHQTAVVTLVATAGEWVGQDARPAQPGFQVAAQEGRFTAHLRAPLQAGPVRIRAMANSHEAYTQIQVQSNLRPGIVAGVINLRVGTQGLNFNDRFKDFLPSDAKGTDVDLKAALFATGRIGDWLFTGAVNSDRPLNQDCECNNRLFRAGDQFPDSQYPVYGDSSGQQFLTPSMDHIYARLERTPKHSNASPDYFMWGDYNTDEFTSSAQQFSALGRQLHGAKFNYNIGDLQITGLYNNHGDGFQRDVLAPDGTTGDYVLSKRRLISGSESIYLELEELDRPGTIVQRMAMERGRDYEIDYQRGTLLFKEAILRTDTGRDAQVLRRQIVANYQFEGPGQASQILAGRLRYHLDRRVNQESWLGATAWQEHRGSRAFSLYGFDGLWSWGDRGRLLAEYAYSAHDSELLGAVSGHAYRVEVEGRFSPTVRATAFYRHTDTGFANDATVSFVPGQTRYGAELTAQLRGSTRLRFSYDHEENRGVAPRPILTLGELLASTDEALPGQRVDTRLTTLKAGVQHTFGRASANLDWIQRDRTDFINPERSGLSSQLRSRLSYPLTSTLTLNALHEMSLSNRVDANYGDRTQLGLDWQLVPGVTLGLNQHWFSRAQFNSQSITTVDLKGDYQLGPDTTLTGRYSILNGINGINGQGAIGIKHRWEVTKGLNLDLAYERILGDLLGVVDAGQRFAQPVAVGQGISTLGLQGGNSFSLGLDYTASPTWKASARFEHRDRSGGSTTNLAAGLTGKLSPALTALIRFNQTFSANQTLANLGPTHNLKVGLAYRNPSNDQLNLLLRYEHRRNPNLIPDSILLGSSNSSSDHLFALETIYAPNWRWEFYGKFSGRFSQTELADDLSVNSATWLGQLRATYHIHNRFDLGAEVRWIGQANYNEMGWVLEGGYALTPNLRLAVGYGFGQISDPDFSSSRSSQGPYVGLTLKLNELFNGFGLQTPSPAISSLMGASSTHTTAPRAGPDTRPDPGSNP